MDRKIADFYRECGIKIHGDITLHSFDDLVNVHVIHRPGMTYALSRNEIWFVWLDSSLPLPERRVRMAHELGHALQHAGSQLFGAESIRLREEEQARRFALYALVPTCFLVPLLPQECDNSESVCVELAEEFGVPAWFMKERLKRYSEDVAI